MRLRIKARAGNVPLFVKSRFLAKTSGMLIYVRLAAKYAMANDPPTCDEVRL
jgi:hypothetical protein